MHAKSEYILRCVSPALLIAAFALFSGCSREVEPPAMRAATSLAGGNIVVVGALPEFPPELEITTAGFFEDAQWDESTEVLRFKGWVPLNISADSTRLILRDPFDQLRIGTDPVLTPQERPDVMRANPDLAEGTIPGFTGSVNLTNLPSEDAWIDTLELYCFDTAGRRIFRLTRADDPNRRSWLRPKDAFTAMITYVPPPLTTPEDTVGSLDVVDDGPIPNTVRLVGWADFDGASSESVLILQLHPDLAPASLRACSWRERPDVLATIDPTREQLRRSGFELIVEFAGDIDDLRRRGAMHLWSIDPTKRAHRVGLSGLKR